MYVIVDNIWFLVGLTFLSVLALWVVVTIYARIHRSLARVLMNMYAGEPIKSYWQRGAGWIMFDMILLLLFFLFVADSLLSLQLFILAFLMQNGIDILPYNMPGMLLLILMSCVGALLVMAYIFARLKRRKKR